jgi:hypothetical protein
MLVTTLTLGWVTGCSDLFYPIDEPLDTMIFAGFQDPQELSLDAYGDYLAWSDGTDVYTCQLEDCKALSPEHESATTFLQDASATMLFGDHVYWIDSGSSVLRVERDARNSPDEDLAATLRGAKVFARHPAQSDYFYVASDSQIKRVSVDDSFSNRDVIQGRENIVDVETDAENIYFYGDGIEFDTVVPFEARTGLMRKSHAGGAVEFVAGFPNQDPTVVDIVDTPSPDGLIYAQIYDAGRNLTRIAQTRKIPNRDPSKRVFSPLTTSDGSEITFTGEPTGLAFAAIGGTGVLLVATTGEDSIQAIGLGAQARVAAIQCTSFEGQDIENLTVLSSGEARYLLWTTRDVDFAAVHMLQLRDGILRTNEDLDLCPD